MKKMQKSKPAEKTQNVENETCNSGCECRKPAGGNNMKKIIFAVVVLAMLAIIGLKVSAKLHAAERERQEAQTVATNTQIPQPQTCTAVTPSCSSSCSCHRH